MGGPSAAGIVRQQHVQDQLELATNIVETCGGRLTLLSGDPSPVANQTGKTTVYWTPYKSGGIGLWDGYRWLLKLFTETGISVPATTNTNFDVFAYLASDSSLTFSLEVVNWTNATTRATGLSFQDGILCKSGDKTRRYLGTCRTTGTTGQCEDSLTKRFVYNYHHKLNRAIRRVYGDDRTWNYGTGAFRVANNDQDNKIEVIIGWPDVYAALQVDSVNAHPDASPQVDRSAGVGVDSYTGNSGTTGPRFSAMNGLISFCSSYLYTNPTIGYHFFAWLEFCTEASPNPALFYAPGSGIHGNLTL